MPDNNSQQQADQDAKAKAEADAKARERREASRAVTTGLLEDPVGMAKIQKAGETSQGKRGKRTSK